MKRSTANLLLQAERRKIAEALARTPEALEAARDREANRQVMEAAELARQLDRAEALTA